MASQIIVSGLAKLEEEFQRLAGAARAEGDAEWWVGTTVEYAIFPELGTRYMTARPYFVPALNELMTELGLEGMTQEYFHALIADDPQLIPTIAFELERRVKAWIKKQHLIDTGNLHGSIAAAGSFTEMTNLSESRRIDKKE